MTLGPLDPKATEMPFNGLYVKTVGIGRMTEEPMGIESEDLMRNKIIEIKALDGDSPRANMEDSRGTSLDNLKIRVMRKRE